MNTPTRATWYLQGPANDNVEHWDAAAGGRSRHSFWGIASLLRAELPRHASVELGDDLPGDCQKGRLLSFREVLRRPRLQFGPHPDSLVPQFATSIRKAHQSHSCIGCTLPSSEQPGRFHALHRPHNSRVVEAEGVNQLLLRLTVPLPQAHQ